MKFSLKSLGSVLSPLGLFTISFSFSLPVEAVVPCQGDTVNYYQNGSVESCIIENNVYISQGSLNFTCKQGYSIFFDEKAQFKSCVISAPVRIITGNAVKTCPEKSLVSVSILNDGNQSVICHHL